MEKNTRIDEAAVWRRVNAAAEQGAKHTGKQTADHPGETADPLPFGLLTAMTEGAALYTSFSGLYSRTGNKIYSQLAQGQRKENKGLKSLYFLLTGREPVVQKGKVEEKRGEKQHEYLRRLLTAQGRHLETLGSLSAQSSGKTADALRSLKEDAGKRWSLLLSQLQKRL